MRESPQRMSSTGTNRVEGWQTQNSLVACVQVQISLMFQAAYYTDWELCYWTDVWISSLILPLVLYFWARWFILFSPSFFVWNKGDEGTVGISQGFSVCVFLVLEVRWEVYVLCWNERYFFGRTVVMGVVFGLGSHGSLFWWFTNKICSGLDLGKCRLSPWLRLSSALPARNPLPTHGSGKVNMFAESKHQGFTVTSGDLLF